MKKCLLVLVFVLFATKISAYDVVKLGPEYFPDPDRSRAIANGYIYVGQPDLDPTVPANQKQLSIQQENGTIIQVTQPLRTNSGGMPVYNGSPVTPLVIGDYSLAILSSELSQKYYFPSSQHEVTSYYYPDYTSADQGVTGDNNTIKYYVDLIGSENSTIVLRHNSGSATTTYTLTTSETIPENITLKFERGAIIDGVGTITIDGFLDTGFYKIFNTDNVDGINPGYVEWFGAIGDGLTDDTSAFQKIESVLTNKTLVLLAKTYVTSYFPKAYAFNIDSGIRNFIGTGPNTAGTYINYTGSTTCLESADKTATTGGSTYGTVRNIGFSYTGGATAPNGIDMTRLRYWYVDSIYTYGFNKNLYLNESWGCSFNSCYFYDGVTANVDVSSTEPNGIDFINCKNYNSAIGWDINNGRRVSIIGGVTEGNVIGVQLGASEVVSFTDHYFEANNKMFDIGWILDSAIIDRCRFKANASTTDYFYVDMGDSGRSGNLTIINSEFNTAPTSGKFLTNVLGNPLLTIKDNLYDFSFTEIRTGCSGLTDLSYRRLVSDIPLQIVAYDSGVTSKDSDNILKVFKPHISQVMVVGSIKEAGATDTNVVVNAGDPLLIFPSDTIAYPAGVGVYGSYYTPASVAIKNDGVITANTSAVGDLQIGINFSFTFQK